MAEAILTDHQPRPPPSDIDNGEFDCLPIPPMDPLFLSAQISSFSDATMAAEENLGSDLHFSLEDNYDLDITFDDLEDLYFPSENENFNIPDCGGDTDMDVFRQIEDSASIESGSSGVSGDHASDVAKYLNCSPSESRCSDSGCQSSNSGAQLNSSSSPVSSHVSGYGGGSGVSEAMNAPSPDSDSSAIVADQKVKTEDVKVKKCSLPKRKKEITGEDTSSGEERNQKYPRSENSNAKIDANDSNCNSGSFVGDDDDKRKARLIRNRESAQLSRQRKKHYVEELEDKVRSMHSTIADLNNKVSFFMAENATLRQQLSGNGMCNPPMYPPMAPMPYPWMPCAPYVVKSQGSQVPLVPIPRLKPQQPVSASKPKKTEAKKAEGKSEAKKAEGKSKKVTSMSVLGLMLSLLVFGGMVGILDVKFGGVGENGANGFGSVGDKYYDTHRTGRVLMMVDGNSNGSHDKVDIDRDRIHCGRGRDGRVEHSPNSDNFAKLNDSGKQLSASLYVPRNDKLVKIDGNLIIHSVLATEKAMASNDVPEVNKNKETSLALPKDFSPALAIPHSDVSSNRGVHPQRYRTPKEGHNALPSRSSDTLKDQMKSSAANGKLQQWFHEGLAGPLLSSGMCTEVFQFDTSPAPGAIVAATSVSNITSNRQQNATRHTRAKNRRFLHGLQIPLSGSDLNITGEHVPSSQKDKFQGNKSVSSMVVSVLVDPRENSDAEVDGVIKPKSLSRIFVVVLMDSVKYVTYSCMLPRSGPHLVTT